MFKLEEGLSQKPVTLSAAPLLVGRTEGKGLPLDEKQMLREAKHDKLSFLDSPPVTY